MKIKSPANRLFFLNSVDAHISADVISASGSVILTCTSDLKPHFKLIVEVSRISRERGQFTVGYEIHDANGLKADQPPSIPMPWDVTQGVVTAIINDAFCLQAGL